jgi:hypothetical protein
MTCTAFEGSRRIASGTLDLVARATKRVLDRGEDAPVLIFDDETSRPVEVDFRGTEEEVLAKLPMSVAEPALVEETRRKVGRPKLGVVAREVTLLPRHWDWLSAQPGGASVTLRRLVDEARNVNATKDRVRQAQESAYRFMSAMAGNEPGFEEAIRALFAKQRKRFDEWVDAWPIDIRDHARKLASAALD